MEFSEPTLAFDRDIYRAATIKMMTDFAPTHFLTFAFNSDVSATTATAKLSQFKQWLYRAITGKRGCDGSALEHIATIEHEATNLHIHAVFRVPVEWQERFEQHGRHIWAKLWAAGSLDIKHIYDPAGIAGYITKELRPHESHRLLV